MNYLSSFNYLEDSKTDERTYTYKGEEVKVIIVFKDINVAMVEDNSGKIYEISIDFLQWLNSEF